LQNDSAFSCARIADENGPRHGIVTNVNVKEGPKVARFLDTINDLGLFPPTCRLGEVKGGLIQQ
jgi:hypothetical protein